MKESWKIKNKIENLDQLPYEEAIEKTIKTILKNRGIDDDKAFLEKRQVDLEMLTEIQSIFGNELEQSTTVIKDAIEQNYPIIIHGDYDVDGVSATAILWETIYYEIGYKNVHPFIPHRERHGYGLSESSLSEIVSTHNPVDGGVLITVDCGITSKENVAKAKKLGLRVIVTDHHTKPDPQDMPEADAILHTTDLCGAGISWVLAQTLTQQFKPSAFNPSRGVDLVALATIADLQSLQGYNRWLVIAGLDELSLTKRHGLQALYDIVGITGKKIRPYEVGWTIAPRINASGRLDHALEALRLLVVRNPQQAYGFAQKLHQLNFQRQKYTEEAVAEAIEMVKSSWNETSPIIVASPDWHEGVIGLIAARLVEEFKVPAMAVSIGSEMAKGSARSVKGVNVTEMLRDHASILEGVGGHAMAAGFSVNLDNLDNLKTELGNRVLHDEWDLSESNMISVDLEIPANLISWDLYLRIAQLEPFGVGNPKPTFVAINLPVSEIKTVGKTNNHLKLKLADNINGIGFGLGELSKDIQPGDSLNVIFTIEEDTYRGGNSVQVKVKDVQKTTD